MPTLEFHTPYDQQTIKATFDDHGYIVLRSFLNPDDVQSTQQELNRYIRNVIPKIPPEHVFYEDKTRPDTLKQLPHMQQHDTYFKNLLLGNSPFSQLANHLLGGAVGRNLQLLRKPPAVGQPTPPHQDGYYYMIEPCEGLTMWLGLDVADEENGCLRYVHGSHKQGLRPHARTQTLGFSQGITDYGTPYDRDHEIAYTAQPGDLLVHHALTVHRADGNNSPTRQRAALGLVYLSDKARENPAELETYRKKLAEDWKNQGKI